MLDELKMGVAKQTPIIQRQNSYKPQKHSPERLKFCLYLTYCAPYVLDKVKPAVTVQIALFETPGSINPDSNPLKCETPDLKTPGLLTPRIIYLRTLHSGVLVEVKVVTTMQRFSPLP